MKYLIALFLFGFIGGEVLAQVVAIDKTHVQITKTVTQNVTVNQLTNLCNTYTAQEQHFATLEAQYCPMVNQAINAESNYNGT